MGKVPLCSTWVDRGLSKKCLKSLKKITTAKRASLFKPEISNREESCDVITWSQCYKTFFFDADDEAK